MAIGAAPKTTLDGTRRPPETMSFTASMAMTVTAIAPTSAMPSSTLLGCQRPAYKPARVPATKCMTTATAIIVRGDHRDHGSALRSNRSAIAAAMPAAHAAESTSGSSESRHSRKGPPRRRHLSPILTTRTSGSRIEPSSLRLAHRHRRYDPERSSAGTDLENAVIQPSHKPTGRRRRTSRHERDVVYGLAAVAALVAMRSGAEPTGLTLVDLGYAGLAGALFALAGSRSRRWTWILSSLATMWAAVGAVGIALALVALVMAIASAWAGRNRWMGAALTIPLVAALGDLGSGSFHGSTTLVAVLIASPMLLSASLHLTESGRQTLIAVVTISTAVVVLATVLFAAATFLALGDVNDAVAEANTAFDVAATGDEITASEHFDVAAEKFRSARRVRPLDFARPSARLIDSRDRRDR